MVIFYKKSKKYKEIQFTKNKMDLNIRKITNYPPSPAINERNRGSRQAENNGNGKQPNYSSGLCNQTCVKRRRFQGNFLETDGASRDVLNTSLDEHFVAKL